MIKVIFLDIDGVLNSYQNQLNNEKNGVWRSEKIILDSNTMKILKYIIERTGADLVLSSTWRLPEYDGSYSSKENLEKQLAQYGMYLTDETPVIDGLDRPGEILHYLNEHPEITHCVILDDDTDIEAYKDLRPFWVCINPKSGLQQHHVEQVIRVLESETLPQNRKFETMLAVDIHESRLCSHPRTAEEKQLHEEARKTKLKEFLK